MINGKENSIRKVLEMEINIKEKIILNKNVDCSDNTF